MKRAACVMAGALCVLLFSLGVYEYRDLKISSDRMERALETVLKLHRTEHRSKRITLQDVPPYIRLWVEHWQQGRVVSSTVQSESHSGSGPLAFPGETTVHAAAAEIPRGSGRLHVIVNFADARFLATQIIDLPPLEDPDWWSMRFFAGDTVIRGEAETQLLAVWTDASSVPEQLEPWRLTSSTNPLEAWVVKIAFTRGKTAQPRLQDDR